MLGELKQPEYELALLVATCGLRISEALGLKWRDILWSKGLIAMRRTFVHFHLQDGDTCGCPANQGQGDVRAGWGACQAVRVSHFPALTRPCLMDGRNPAVVQSILRHSKMDMTLYYSYSRRQAKRAAQEKVLERLVPAAAPEMREAMRESRTIQRP